ncbi:PucR family transcriptional regulator [Bacillus massiliglaciei]|uniref:PucR family transcriptional regulator n=1 Tax=Bacillus massiliglaciei TaxID=1816693 RepID=UPI000B19AE6B|nr:PucR family transcriptional regulator [Bacillus massiliglaciei]
METSITVEDILKRKYFDQAEVLAGAAGVHRYVKWVHCAEVIQISHLLNGRELILTTGLGWKDSEEAFLSFFEQLLASEASGLCLEMGTYTTNIPQKVIDLANEYGFPIILFHQEVPFVEITQDIHSLIINKQYQLLSNLENYSRQLNKKLLEIEQFEPILKLLSSYLHVQVFLSFNETDIVSIPKLKDCTEHSILKDVLKLNVVKGSHHARQWIQVLGEDYAELMIYSSERVLTEFDYLIMDRTATALAQHFLRDLYIEERKITEESKWLTGWTEGEFSEEEIIERLSYMDPSIRLTGGAVLICKLPPGVQKTAKMDGPYFKILFRTVFEQYGFRVYPFAVQHQMVCILGNLRSAGDTKERISAALDRIKKMDISGRSRISNLSVAVGKYVTRLADMDKSYATARETMQLKHTMKGENLSCFYQDLHMYRMLSILDKHSNLNEMVYEYLAPVIEHDRKYNGELMPTLKTYLACNGSKQETSKQLFIVRQTLYHRLEKLERLLGPNFMEANSRLAIEFMIFAYEYLNGFPRKDHIQATY